MVSNQLTNYIETPLGRREAAKAKAHTRARSKIRFSSHPPRLVYENTDVPPWTVQRGSESVMNVEYNITSTILTPEQC